MSNERVDVLRVLRLIAEGEGDTELMAMRVHSAVAELIEADKEYDAAMARRVTATNAIVSGDRSDDAFRRQANADHAFDRAASKRRAALSRIGGKDDRAP